MLASTVHCGHTQCSTLHSVSWKKKVMGGFLNADNNTQTQQCSFSVLIIIFCINALAVLIENRIRY